MIAALRSSPRRSAAVLLLVLLAWPLAAFAATQPALVIEHGSVAREQVVAVGRDLVVAGRALADVAAMNGRVTISGEVVGDVIVLGGGAHLDPTAKVGGDVFVLGGTIEAAPGATINGRSVAYPDASGAWLALLEAPTIGLNATAPLVIGAKLALLAAWMTLVLVFFAATGRQVLATSESVQREPFRCFYVGLTGVVTLVLTALFFSLFSRALVGIPLLVLVVLLAMILKLWGMVAVFHAFGDWLLARFPRHLTPLNTAAIGLMVLGGIKFLPWIGLLTWHVATFIGVGAALSSKLGRREPWFDLSPQPAL